MKNLFFLWRDQFWCTEDRKKNAFRVVYQSQPSGTVESAALLSNSERSVDALCLPLNKAAQPPQAANTMSYCHLAKPELIVLLSCESMHINKIGQHLFRRWWWQYVCICAKRDTLLHY